MLSSVVGAALVLASEAEGEHHEIVNELPFPSFYFGLIAFGALIALLLLTYAFKSVSTRHPDRDGMHEGPHDAPHDARAGSGH
ncbi:hypothetical protein WDV85_15865 [Pseudokineococcus sp. 5B2Z-1]|uniref:hypothetical protein n=1 Tax=Pseudokineococcus sp. 5B2Z-1 TaxID=3132744 RepID=UPI0030B08FEA